MRIDRQEIRAGNVVQLDPRSLKMVGINRETNALHIGRLRKSMEQENLLHLNPIKVNERLEVIDGQHRLSAALELGWKSVTCMVVAGTVHDAIKLNLNQKNWSMPDFAHYWASQGRKSYSEFIEFCGITDMQPSVAMGLMTGANLTGGGQTNDFRTGSFKVKYQQDFLLKFLDKVDDFKPYLQGAERGRPFVMALWKLYMSKDFSYDHDRMMHKLKMIGVLRKTVETKVYTEQLEEVYNYKVRSAEKVRFR